jgi:chitin disaccharide deacetylase
MGQRFLVVIADDFGIGPETSQGILDLAARGIVTGSVLLVNSPHAEQAVRTWRQAGMPMELGWHPCLTLDTPILPAERVPSLVDAAGTFWPLGRFIKRMFLGRIDAAEVEAEFRAQYQRFTDLLGQPPTLVNAHQHCNLFHPVGSILLDILGRRRPLPYVRRIQEPWRMLLRIPGARKKRMFLTVLGRPLARLQEQQGFPGNAWLMGITDPRWVKDQQFFDRWLSRIPGEIVELSCHPGHPDATLIGRDCTAHDGLMQRRVDEWSLMNQPGFIETCRRLGFVTLSPSELGHVRTRRTFAA